VRVLGLQHIACEHPGAFADVLRERGAEYVAVELDEGERPPDWRGFDAVLAMGGPMSAGDEAGHPWLREEKALLRDAVEAGRPFLGVCLGAQLLAAALGAPVHPNPAGPEVGLLPVERTAAGRADPVLGALDEPLVTLQWHGDTFGLPPGGELLASSPLARHQAFRVGRRAYGVQFHLEVTGAMARQWAGVPAYAASLRQTLGEARGRAFLEQAIRRAPALAVQARTLFARWLATFGQI
jgi:GMP synthase (glutamine-hydrolysing)